MARRNTILVIIDPTSKAQPALKRAEWLAKTRKLALEIFACEYDQALAGDRFFDTSALKKARAGLMDRLRARLERLAEPGSVVDRGAAPFGEVVQHDESAVDAGRVLFGGLQWRKQARAEQCGGNCDEAWRDSDGYGGHEAIVHLA